MAQHTGVADAFVKALNAHDVAKLGDTLAEDVAYWEANLPSPIMGRRAVENHFRENWKSFPDATIRVTNRIVGEDSVVDEIMWSATQTGPIKAPGMTIPPTGKKVQGPAVGVAKIEKGKIARLNIYYDNMGMLAQLGVMPGGGQR